MREAVSCRVVSCRVVSCRVVSCRVVSVRCRDTKDGGWEACFFSRRIVASLLVGAQRLD